MDSEVVDSKYMSVEKERLPRLPRKLNAAIFWAVIQEVDVIPDKQSNTISSNTNTYLTIRVSTSKSIIICRV